MLYICNSDSLCLDCRKGQEEDGSGGGGRVLVRGKASRTAALPNYTPKNADSLWSTRNLMGVHKVSLQISSKLFLNKLVCVFLLMHILCTFF